MPVVINGTTGITTPTESVATTIGVGGATPSASGAGITFPATASLSSNANTLDDYEEGTWTPSVSASGGGTITAITTTSGSIYTRIGNLVTCSAEVNITNFSGTSGNIWISLPISGGGQNSNAAVRLSGSWGATTVTSVQGLVEATATRMLFTRFYAGAEYFDLASVYSGSVNLYLRFTVSYFAN